MLDVTFSKDMKDFDDHIDYDDTYRLIFLVALSSMLQMSESIIPHPIPGLRLGLANVITLVTIFNMGIRYALIVTLLRTLLSSFIMGSFMSPGFALSISGGIMSTLLMGLCFWLSKLNKRYGLGIVGMSIIGALAHNMIQIVVAYLMFFRNKGLFVFVPWLGLGSVITGFIVGSIAAGICRKILELKVENALSPMEALKPFENGNYMPGSSLIHRTPPGLKLLIAFALTLSVILFNSLWFHLFLFLSLIFITFLSGIRINVFLSRLKGYVWFLLMSFIFPLFIHCGDLRFNILHIKVSPDIFIASMLSFSRITLIVFIGVLLTSTTSVKELTTSVSRALFPLKLLGISSEQASYILYKAWLAIPFMWHRAKDILQRPSFGERKGLKRTIDSLSEFIASFYLLTGKTL